MKATDVPYILWHRPFLDGFDFVGVNMYPTFIDHKPKKDDTLYIESALVYVGIELMVSKERQDYPKVS